MKTKNPDRVSRRVPAKWKPHFQKLQALHKSLTTGPPDLEDMARAEAMSDELDHYLTLGILSCEDNALDEVEAAIQRIFDGSYGICKKTGKPIPDSRLRVVPWTRYTKDALECLERQQRAKTLQTRSECLPGRTKGLNFLNTIQPQFEL